MQQKLTTATLDEARNLLRQAISKAAETLVKLLDSDDPKLQLKAAEAILSRAGITQAERMSNQQAECTVGGKPDPFAL